MNETGRRPQIGVISDSVLQRHVLQKALDSFGLSPIISCEPGMLEQQQSEKVDQVQCWVLALEDESVESQALDKIIDQADDVPVLFGLETAPSKHDEQYISWERRLVSKLEEHIGSIDILESEDSLLALNSQIESSAGSIQSTVTSLGTDRDNCDIDDVESPISDQVWVLAASLGGPAAVKEFLDEIPASIKAGFLYAQHIDAHFSNVLTQVLGRHSMLDLNPISAQNVIRDGEVLVVPVDNAISFSNEGILIEKEEWEGPYGPSIDHLLKNLFTHYGNRCHVIVFSGMGNDGALMAPRMYQQGCSVWTQTPDSCANSSMPQSIIDLECSHYTGSPKELARALINKVGCHSNNEPATNNPDIHQGA